jgi:hypothetical protein
MTAERGCLEDGPRLVARGGRRLIRRRRGTGHSIPAVAAWAALQAGRALAFCIAGNAAGGEGVFLTKHVTTKRLIGANRSRHVEQEGHRPHQEQLGQEQHNPPYQPSLFLAHLFISMDS